MELKKYLLPICGPIPILALMMPLTPPPKKRGVGEYLRMLPEMFLIIIE